MPECPVCQTEYVEPQVERCSTCFWDLTPYPMTFAGQIPQAFLEKERAKIAWAKEQWARSQPQLSQLQSNQEANEEKAHLQAQLEQSKQALLQFQSQLDEIQAQLKLASEERSLLRSEVANLNQIQSQLPQILSSEISTAISQLESTLYQKIPTQLQQYPEQEHLKFLADLHSQVFHLKDELELLFTASGLYYKKLWYLLAAEKWKEADEETLAVMLKIAGREKEGKFDVTSLENFPCNHLRTIDQLWVKYSNGHFGFSVQKRIWESVGGKSVPDEETNSQFLKRLGWYVTASGKPIYNHSDFTFTLKAPEGHLPAKFGWQGGGWEVVSVYFFSRVETCQL